MIRLWLVAVEWSRSIASVAMPRRRVETEGDVGPGDVVVDGFGQSDDVQPGLLQPQGVLLRAAAADANEGVEMVAVVSLDDGRGHVPDLAADLHLVRLIAAGAQDGSAAGENAREHVALQGHGAVVDQSAKAVAEADHFHPKNIARRLPHAADGGVQAGTITAAGQDTNVLGHVSDLRPSVCTGNYSRQSEPSEGMRCAVRSRHPFSTMS